MPSTVLKQVWFSSLQLPEVFSDVRLHCNSESEYHESGALQGMSVKKQVCPAGHASRVQPLLPAWLSYASKSSVKTNDSSKNRVSHRIGKKKKKRFTISKFLKRQQLFHPLNTTYGLQGELIELFSPDLKPKSEDYGL